MLNFWIYCQELIKYLKYTCPAHLYATSISPPAAQQIISSIKVILGEDGSNRGLASICAFLWLFACNPKCIHAYTFFVLKLSCCNTGAQKLAKIRENSNFFRSELQKMGFEVLGDNDSPVMPIMLYNPAKIPAFSRECLKHNVRTSTSNYLCFLLMSYILGMNNYLFCLLKIKNNV